MKKLLKNILFGVTLLFSLFVCIGIFVEPGIGAKKEETTIKYQKIYLSSGTKYKITKVVKYLKKEELQNKKIQWKCNSKAVRIKNNNYIWFLKDGNYKLVGRIGESKKYIIPLVVQTSIMPKKNEILEIRIRHSGMTARLNDEVDVSISDKSQIDDFLCHVSQIKAKLDVEETYKKPLSGSEGYNVVFKYSIGNSIKWDLYGSVIKLTDIKMYPNGIIKMDYKSKRAFKGRNVGDFFDYVVSIYQDNQKELR